MKVTDKNRGLTVERLRFLLDYNQGEGVFRWKNKPSKNANNISIGDVAGTFHESSGYWSIYISGYHYGAHRLAWLYITGEWPADMIDHRDTDKLNNAFYNLRECSNSFNKANGKVYKKKNSHLPKGVYIVRSAKEVGKRYGGQIRKDGKLHNLGSFYTPEEAHAAYVEAAKKLHGEFAHDGNVLSFEKVV